MDLDSAQASRWLPQEFPPSCPHCGTATNFYSLWCVFDGHNGVHAAKMAGEAVLPILESRLPLGSPPPPNHPLYARFREGIQRSLVETTVELNSLFAQRGIHAGATSTIVLQVGWLVTAANLGDSRAVLDTGSEVIPLTADHRVATHKAERRRVEAMGGVVAPIAMTGSGPADDYSSGVGPLRIWPGGLSISRAIGDFDVGNTVLPFPNLMQVVIPPTGGRLLIGSDGVWDAFDKMTRAGGMSRSWSTETAPSRMIQTIVRAFGGLKDDTSLIVVDVLPNEHTSFPQVASGAKRSSGSSSGSVHGGSGAAAAGGAGGGGCLCFGGTATVDGGHHPPPDSSVNASVRSASSINSSVRAGKVKAEILIDIDVAGIMGLMPDPVLSVPAWYSEHVGEVLFRAAAEASDAWHASNAKRYARPPATPSMPEMERPSRKQRKVAFAKTVLEQVREREKSETQGPMRRSASQAFVGSTAQEGQDYAAKFGHYTGAGVGDMSVRAGRVFNTDASVRAGNALESHNSDPSVRLRGSSLDGSVRMKASSIDDADVTGLAPVRVVKRGGPPSRPLDVPASGSGHKANGKAQDSVSELHPKSLQSIGE